MKIAHDIGEYGARVAGLMELFLVSSGLFISLPKMLSKWFHPTDPQIIEKKRKKHTLESWW